MFGATVDVTEALVGAIDLEGVDPYENWEKTTRPAGAAVSPLWQPVYVELLADAGGGLAEAAATLLAQISASREIAVDETTHDMLRSVASGSAPRLADRRFFFFRPEAVAHRASLAAGAAIPVKLLHVGPAMPTAFVTDVGALSAPLGAMGQGVASTVITGVIDDVMGFANERFRKSPDTTRIERFWMQGMPVISAGRAVIGGEIDRAGIDRLLQSQKEEGLVYDRLFPKGVYVIKRAPRGELGLTPYESLNARPFALAQTHGTQVMDLAAGWPMGSAPADRPIMAVELPQLATLETWGARLDLFILLGLQRLFYWADRWAENGQIKRAPLVVNISYGVLAGPKDGSGHMESEIARMVAARNAEGVPTFVVLPAGNGFRDNCHAEFDLAPGDSKEVTLRLQPDDQSVSFVELWLDSHDRARLSILPPQGTKFERLIVPSDSIYDWQGSVGGGLTFPMARVYVRPYPATTDGQSGRTRVTIAFLPSQNHEVPHQVVPAGPYTLSLMNDSARPLGVQIETQRDETPPSFPAWGRQAYLDHALAHGWDPQKADYSAPEPGCAVTRKGTLSGYATHRTAGVVVVGASFDRDALAQAALYSGSGPTPGRARPDVSVVAEETRVHAGVMAAATLSGGVTLFSGTSNAAPQVTRALVGALASNPGITATNLAMADLPDGRLMPGPDDQLGPVMLPYRLQQGRPPRRMRS